MSSNNYILYVYSDNLMFILVIFIISNHTIKTLSIDASLQGHHTIFSFRSPHQTKLGMPTRKCQQLNPLIFLLSFFFSFFFLKFL